MPRFWHGLRSAIWKTRLEREMEEEIAFHLFMRERGGDAPETVRRRFGNTTLIQEQVREMNTFQFLESVRQDVRYAWRGLRATPGFTAVAVLSLALGIGANTAIFTLTNGVLLRMLPVERPEELRLFTWYAGEQTPMHDFWGSHSHSGGRQSCDSFSYAAYQALRKNNVSFADVFAFKRKPGVTATIDGRSEKVSAEIVSANMYSTLGLKPGIGRAMTPSDEEDGAPRVALLSYGYWSRRFARDPRVLGMHVDLNAASFAVIGVNPRDFGGFETGDGPEIYVPVTTTPVIAPREANAPTLLADPDYWWVQMMGRMKPEVGDRQSMAAFDVTLANVVKALPRKEGDDIPKLELSPGGRVLNRGDYEMYVYILSAMVGLVLMIACANLANLLLARSAARQRELAVRLALGASRWRLVRQILTESMMLAGAGGVIGIGIGYWTKNLIPRMLEDEWSPHRVELPFDYHVLFFTVTLSVLTAFLFGLIPSLRATGGDVNAKLKSGGRISSQSRSHSRLGKGLVAAQIALSILLLVPSGLFARTLMNLRSVGVGFKPDRLLLFALDPPEASYTGNTRVALFEHVLERIRAIPGVQMATMSEEPLLSNTMSGTNFVPTGQTDSQREAWENTVGTEFFRTIGVPMVVGRALNERDTAAAPAVAVVNQTLARKFFGGVNPIGKTFNDERIRIVGICGDARYDKVREPAPPTYYRPLSQIRDFRNSMTFELKTAGDPYRFVGAVRDAIASIDKDIPPFEIRTQEQQMDANMARERLFATLTSTFSALALVLACIGIYGVMAYTVARRTNEIGIRMALGARRAQVLGMVMSETSRMAIAGVGIGISVALPATRLIESMLFEVKQYDPVTLTLSGSVMLAAGLIAGFLPARRASRVDPNVALRYE